MRKQKKERSKKELYGRKVATRIVGENLQVRFSIPGEPKGKGRPRFMRNGHTYTPQETVEYENWVRLSYRTNAENYFFQNHIALSVRMDAYFGIPKSTSKKKRKMMETGDIRPVVKRDCDNIAKIVLDALNHIAYHDDAQVVELVVCKWYDEQPRVDVLIKERMVMDRPEKDEKSD